METSALPCVGPKRNLTAKQRNRMMRIGVILFALVLAAGLGLTRADVAPGFRAALFVPFLFATYTLLLGLYGQCTFTAARGMRQTDEGTTERVADRSELSEMRRGGWRVAVGAFSVAALATLPLLF